MQRASQRLKVLAVDDDVAEHALLRHHGESIDGYDVSFFFETGSEGALGTLAREPIDVVLLDYELGAENGLTVLRAIRGSGHEDVPIVFLTGRGDEQVAVSALQAGAVDYLPKGALSTNSLKRVLGNAVERGRLRKLITQHRRNLERTTADLTRRNREVEGFYHTVSHELKTPLSAIDGFLRLVTDGLCGEVPEEALQYIGMAMESCRQMRRCVDDMLDISRLESGKVAVDLAPVDLAHVAEHAVLSLRPTAVEHDVELEFVVASSSTMALADAHRIGQVLRNLISNGLKFTSQGGRVVVTLDDLCAADELRISVGDTGRGIPRDHLSRIFDRLHQVRDEDYAEEGGLGLGLSICKQLVGLHGGELSVESEVGRGTTFSFTLPLHVPVQAATAGEEAGS